MAFVPHALVSTGNDTWDSQVMQIQDSLGVSDWTYFVGGTVLRVVLDVVCDRDVFDWGNADYHQSIYTHFGFAMLNESAPLQDRWDPNNPHGEFMWRGTQYQRMDQQVTNVASSITITGDPGVFHIDSRQRRRIREDDQMWAFAHWFQPATSGTPSCGYVGRVLIALP